MDSHPSIPQMNKHPFVNVPIYYFLKDVFKFLAMFPKNVAFLNLPIKSMIAKMK